MLYFKYLFTFAVLLFSSQPTINKTESARIAWDKNYHLEWKDFKANVDRRSSLDAYTMLGLSLEVVSQNNGKIDMGVFGYFEKNKSWVKKSEKTKRLLAHEQKHFDLCEVYRRKLIKKLEANSPYSFDGFSNEVQTIFNQTFDAYTKEQARYDQKTNHSQNKEQQIKWNKFIAKELLRLEKYDKIAATLSMNN